MRAFEPFLPEGRSVSTAVAPSALWRMDPPWGTPSGGGGAYSHHQVDGAAGCWRLSVRRWLVALRANPRGHCLLWGAGWCSFRCRGVPVSDPFVLTSRRTVSRPTGVACLPRAADSTSRRLDVHLRCAPRGHLTVETSPPQGGCVGFDPGSPRARGGCSAPTFGRCPRGVRLGRAATGVPDPHRPRRMVTRRGPSAGHQPQAPRHLDICTFDDIVTDSTRPLRQVRKVHLADATRPAPEELAGRTNQPPPEGVPHHPRSVTIP